MWLLIAAACGTPNDTVAPPGDPTRFDPVASLDDVAAYAGPGARVASFRAGWIGSNGTIDLTHAKGVPVTYQFTREVPAPPDAPPVGAGGSVDGRYHVDVSVEVGPPGTWRHVTSGGSEWDYEFRGMERSVGSVQPGAVRADLPASPTCSLGGLWSQVEGIPAGAVATVDYGPSGYELWVEGTGLRGRFDAWCRPIGDGTSAVPAAPPVEPPREPRDDRRSKRRP